jgi:hypothetical protein
MSESNNNNFRELKQLLKLKQHEVPPPGYFNHFSGDVIARIRDGETGEPEGLLRLGSGSFMGSLLNIFQAKPGVIGGFATSLCLLLLISVVLAERPDGSSSTGDLSGLLSSQSGNIASASPTLMPAGGASGISISTNTIISLQPGAALFSSAEPNPLFQPASFTTPGQ